MCTGHIISSIEEDNAKQKIETCEYRRDLIIIIQTLLLATACM
jgi:hypothetical protein